MSDIGKYLAIRRIVTYEMIGFLLVIVMIWLNEVIDIPYLMLGAEKTPLNWNESLFESICIGVLGALVIKNTFKILKRMKHLEGILPICASCKKIRDEKGDWHQIESYIYDRSDAKFSHGICPECEKRLYPEEMY